MGTITSRRKLLIILLGLCLLVLFAVLGAMNAFNWKFLNVQSTSLIYVFTALSALGFVLFVVVLLLLVRNILKLYADQKSTGFGAGLRARMLWGAVVVSTLPIVFMFTFSYGLLNRAVERWFSTPVTEMRDDSNRMALELTRYAAANARVEADSIAGSLPASNVAISVGDAASQKAIDPILRRHELTLQGGFAVVYREGRTVASFHMPSAPGAAVKAWTPGRPTDEEDDTAPARVAASNASDPTDAAVLAAAQRNDQPVFSLGQTDFALGTAAVKQGGTVVVGLPMPFGVSATMAHMRSSSDTYRALLRGRRELRNLYMILLLMITCLALFASSWMALHLARQVTTPVEALAEAMGAVAGGDYARRVGETGTEELAELVQSFNRMAADLEGSRAQVEASTVQLSAVNATLEARRSELETMLETIPNGVATLDEHRSVVLTNRALSEMMDPGGQRQFLGSRIEEVFPTEVVEVLDRLIRRSHRMGSASGEVETKTPDGTMFLLATVALLESSGDKQRAHRGYVLVLENATELLRAQKQSAWKEVARRVAHEIKNPLTPISLSAEQIRRHIDRLGVETPSSAVIRRCSEVITASVESMRQLVDQFATLAEFPAARPRPADLNTIVENSLAIFAGRMQSVRVVKALSQDLPLVLADPEALKRALGNLVDNAVEAMQRSLLRELRIGTAALEGGMVELTVADTGAGLTDEMRERLFLPYFSTKQRGTGLGLAIAAKIIQEHGGTIRAEKNSPAGAKFIVELRPASGGDTGNGEPVGAAAEGGGA